MESETLAFDALDRLVREHRDVMSQLDALEMALGRFKEKDTDANCQNLRNVEDLLQYLERDLDLHLRKEEEVLFPAVSRLSPGLQEGPLTVMIQEHHELRRNVDRLKKAIEVLHVEFDGGSLGEMRHAGYEFIDVLKLHIRKEDSCLFPMVRQFLDRARLLSLEEQMRFLESGSGHLPG